MRHGKQRTGGGLALLLGVMGPSLAQATPPSTDPAQCFDLSRHQGVLALDDRTVLVRVDANLYRLDLADRCPGLERPDPRITLVAHGGTYVCGKLDYDLHVGEGGLANALPCTIASQRRLTPKEVAAIPRNKRP
ncbi:MAG: DUF6491 family protein [Caulobacteraceae bacterium]